LILSFHVIFVLSVLSPIVCATRAKFLFTILSLAYRYGTLVTPLLKDLFPFLTFMLGLW